MMITTLDLVSAGRTICGLGAVQPALVPLDEVGT
jgi:hypothetical protein